MNTYEYAREPARYETAAEESDEFDNEIFGESRTGLTDSEVTSSSAVSSHLSCHTTDYESSRQGRPETEERGPTWFDVIQKIILNCLNFTLHYCILINNYYVH